MSRTHDGRPILADPEADYRCWLDWTAGTWAGPLADECGGAPAGGDNDFDGPHREYPGYRRWDPAWTSSTARIVVGGVGPDSYRYAEVPGFVRTHLYWPPDCDGADDTPRDCMEA